MTNNDEKNRNGKTITVIAGLLILFVSILFCAGFLWVFAEERRRNEALKPTAAATLLPIVAGPFKQDKFIVYELEHGWMVVREAGVSSHFFVPKPSKQE